MINTEGTFTGDNSLASDNFSGQCSSDDAFGLDSLYTLVTPRDTTVCVQTTGSDMISGGLSDTVTYVRTNCSELSSELICNDDIVGGLTRDSAVQWTATAGVPYALIIDSYSALTSSVFQFTVTFSECPR